MNNFMLGIFVGILLITIASYFGEQRYSNAIKQCIIEKGTNK